MDYLIEMFGSLTGFIQDNPITFIAMAIGVVALSRVVESIAKVICISAILIVGICLLNMYTDLNFSLDILIDNVVQMIEGVELP